MTPVKRNFIVSGPEDAPRANSDLPMTRIEPEALQAACSGL